MCACQCVCAHVCAGDVARTSVVSLKPFHRVQESPWACVCCVGFNLRGWLPYLYLQRASVVEQQLLGNQRLGPNWHCLSVGGGGCCCIVPGCVLWPRSLSSVLNEMFTWSRVWEQGPYAPVLDDRAWLCVKGFEESNQSFLSVLVTLFRAGQKVTFSILT
jgi:hypothetical protein